MSYLTGVLAMLGLAGVYVGLGLADRGRKSASGGCAQREAAGGCGACPEDGPCPAGRGTEIGDGADAFGDDRPGESADDASGRSDDIHTRWTP